MSCANNLKQIGLALHDYADTFGYKARTGQKVVKLPAGTIPVPGLETEQRLSWLVAILPFLEQDDLYRRFDQSTGWNSPGNLTLSQTPLEVFVCRDWRREYPSANSWETPYIGIAGLGPNAAAQPLGAPNIGAFGFERRVTLTEVKDGTSNTMMVLESARDTGPWAQGGFATVRSLDPEDKPYLGTGRPFGGTHFTENSIFKKGHAFRCNVLMMDGAVRYLDNSASPEILEALATIAGGEKVPLDW